jgi:hypothetical protein
MCLLGLDGFGEAIERIRPHRLERASQGTETLAIGHVQPSVAVMADTDEARIAKDAEVLGNRPERDIEAGCDIPGRELIAPDEAQDLASTRLGHDLEGVHRSILAWVEM